MTQKDAAALRELEDLCSAMYAEVRKVWSGLEGRLSTWPCGYMPLFGPPRIAPPLMIVGLNPGYGHQVTTDQIAPLTWPPALTYLASTGRLAGALRRMFRAVGRHDLLEQAMATSLIFFRSQSMDKKSDVYRWKDNSPEIRAQLERLSRQWLDRLIAAARPRVVMAIGKETFFKLASETRPALYDAVGAKQVPILRYGALGDTPVIGVPHLSGYPGLSNAQRATMAKEVATAAGPSTPE